MADNVAITAGTGTTVLADELTDGTLGSGKAQFVKIMDGTLDSSNKLKIDTHGSVQALLTKSDGTADTSIATLNSSLTGGVKLLDSAGTNKATIDSHGSQQTTLADSSGNPVPFNANGQATMANSAPTVLASDMPAIKGYYVAVAASQTDSVIQSSTGATGDYLDYVVVVPATTAPGVVTIKDNTTAIISYPGGGTTALLTLTPFTINVGAFSRSGAWKITTGANVSVVAVGKFS